MLSIIVLERCLNQWYEHSGKDHCEICLTKYARTNRVLKPVREWSRPKIGRSVSLSQVFSSSLIFKCLDFLQTLGHYLRVNFNLRGLLFYR